MHVQAPVFDIDFDDIAIAHQRKRPAQCRFGSDVTDAKALGAAAESAIGH